MAPRPIRPVRPPEVRSGPVSPAQVGKKPNGMTPQARRSAFLIMLGLPIFLVSSLALYHRVIEGQEKRVQLGEYTPDGGLRIFSNEEKDEKDSRTWLTRIFGKDK